MIRLDRPYVLLGRDVACAFLRLEGMDPRRLDLAAVHAELRRRCPADGPVGMDGVVIVDDASVPDLFRRMRDEIAAILPEASWGGADVLPRSVALWLHPEMADRPNAHLAAMLDADPDRRPTLVVDDGALSPAFLAFNRHLVATVAFGWSPPDASTRP